MSDVQPLSSFNTHCETASTTKVMITCFPSQSVESRTTYCCSYYYCCYYYRHQYYCFLSLLLISYHNIIVIYRIETKSRSLPHNVRSAVFVHLAKVLSCEKETLIKRAKRMVLAQHDEKLRRPIAVLKEGVVWNFSPYFPVAVKYSVIVGLTV